MGHGLSKWLAATVAERELDDGSAPTLGKKAGRWPPWALWGSNTETVKKPPTVNVTPSFLHHAFIGHLLHMPL